MQDYVIQNGSVFFLAALFLVMFLAEVVIRRRRFWLGIPRIFWLLGLVFLIADISFTQSEEWSQPGTLYVFYDQSDSVMAVPERRQKLQNYLEEIRQWSEKNSQPVEVYSFGSGLKQSSFDLTGLEGELKSLIGEISKVTLKEDGNAVVISDGNWDDYARVGVPTHLVNLGSTDEKDIWIEGMQPVMTAFLKNRLNIPVEIAHRGFEGEEVNIVLRRGGNELARETVNLEGSIGSVEFSYFPEKMGEEVLVVEIEGREDELSELNNRSSLRIRTVRDKIRILHIGGKPSIDLKAWRLFLTRQPDVDLVSFYILRSLDDDPQAKNTELSLIPFPYEELFTTEMDKFDIVILQNFNFNLYFQPSYLVNLAAFIRQGGSLLMMGGDQSFHRYRRSPLVDVLPLKFDNRAGEFEEKSFKAKVQTKHPLVEGLNWAFEIPEWTKRHEVAPNPDAIDLVTYRDSTPFLSIRDVGQGRVMIINTDESWRFQFQPYGPYIPMNRFARRTLQYLTFDPEMEPKRVVSGDWNLNEKVELSLTNNQPTNWSIQEVLHFSNIETFNQKSKIEYLVKRPGVYEVVTSAFGESSLYETKQKPWLREWKNILAKPQRMKSLAAQSEGQYFEYENRGLIFDQELTGKQIISAESQPWLRYSHLASWAVLLMVLGFLCLDFFLRKKFQWDA